MRAVVLGGGIAGSFAALFLRERGFEVIGVGGRPSYPLSSLVLTLSMPHREDVELARRSLEIYRDFVRPKEVLSVDIFPSDIDKSVFSHLEDYRVADEVDGLRLGRDEVAVITKDYLIPVRRIVRRLRSRMGFSDSFGELRVDGRRAYVVADGRRLDGDAIVLAAGHANGQLAERAGLRLPFKPYACYAAVLLAASPIRRYSIGDHVLGWYGRPAFPPPLYIAGDGCGRPYEGPPAGYASRIARLASRRGGPLIPLFSKAGYCEVGPGGGPLYGRHPSVENLYVIGGLDGYGSMVGPALAERLADLAAGHEHKDPFRLEERLDSPDFDPCGTAERHEWNLDVRGSSQSAYR